MGEAGAQAPGPRERAGTLAVGGARLEYAWSVPARPRGCPLVLLHEGLGCVAMWGRFPARLAAATGRAVLSYSRLGYGGSDPAPYPWPLDFMHREARVLPAVLAAAGVGGHVLVGHSDGGSIAAVYAGTPRWHRAPLEAAVLMAAHVFNEPRTRAGIEAAGTAFRSGGLRSALERYHGERVDAVFRGWHDVWLDPAFARWNIEGRLGAIACPLLVLQGREDPYGTLEQVAAIARAVPDGVESAILEGCGHSPHREQPARVLDLIGRFLERVEGAGQGPGRGGGATAP